MKKLITVKLTTEQLGLLATQLHRDIGNLEQVDDMLRSLIEGEREKDCDYDWVSMCMSAADSAQLAAFEKQRALQHLLKTIESTSKQTLTWDNDTQRMEVQS